MECKEAQNLIRCERRFADGLAEPDRVALGEHLAACAACAAYRERERAFDEAVRPAMLGVEIPVALPERIHWALRRDRRARQRRWALITSVAAAALLFVALSVGWYVNRPYDLAALRGVAEWVDDEQVVARYDASQGSEGLGPWLEKHHVPTPVPQRLRLQHLYNAYIVKVGGRRVPVLEFREGASLSKVFLLDSQYYRESSRRHLLAERNVMSYVIVDHPEARGLGWMIVGQGSPQQFVDGELPEGGW